MHSLRRLLTIPATVVAVGAASGCPGCGVPFAIETEGTVVFPLGIIDGCDGTGTIPESGEPDEFGNLTTFTHQNDGTTCNLSADWSGRLLDMAAVREDVDAELAAAGLDPTTVAVSIISMEPTVETVLLRDNEDESPIEFANDGLQAYRGAVSVDGDEDIIVAEYAGEGDPTVPTVTIKDSTRLVELANTALGGGVALDASGGATAQVLMAELPPLEAAAQPAIVITFKIGVAGEAALAP